MVFETKGSRDGNENGDWNKGKRPFSIQKSFVEGNEIYFYNNDGDDESGDPSSNNFGNGNENDPGNPPEEKKELPKLKKEKKKGPGSLCKFGGEGKDGKISKVYIAYEGRRLEVKKNVIFAVLLYHPKGKNYSYYKLLSPEKGGFINCISVLDGNKRNIEVPDGSRISVEDIHRRYPRKGEYEKYRVKEDK